MTRFHIRYLSFILPLVHAMHNVSVTYSDASLIYSGAWFTKTTPGCETQSTAVFWSSFTLQFTGVAIYVFGNKDQSGGVIQVTLDGVNVTTYSTISSSTLCNSVLYANSTLSDGPHTITNTLIGTAPGASNPLFSLENASYTTLDPTDSTTSSQIASPTSSTPSSTSSSTASSTGSATKHLKSNLGAIIGEVMGGIVLVAVLCLVYYYRKALMEQIKKFMGSRKGEHYKDMESESHAML